MSVVTIHFEPNRAAAGRQSLARLLDADARYNRGERIGAEEHIAFEGLGGCSHCSRRNGSNCCGICISTRRGQ